MIDGDPEDRSSRRPEGAEQRPEARADAAPPSSRRHLARQRAVQVLYEADVRRIDPSEALRRVVTDPNAEPLDPFARSLVRGVGENLTEIDATLNRYARGWSVTRMPVVDRNVLRLGTYELLHTDESPAAVAIDEAVELAKTLSTDASPRYVNGVLSAINRDQQRPTG